MQNFSLKIKLEKNTMKIHTTDTLDLNLRGVAIKSGAMKKMEEEKKVFEETASRFMPIGVTPVTKVRPDMAGGFRVPFN